MASLSVIINPAYDLWSWLYPLQVSGTGSLLLFLSFIQFGSKSTEPFSYIQQLFYLNQSHTVTKRVISAFKKEEKVFC